MVAGSGDEVALRVTDLTKRYGDLVAVDGLSLAVRRGEILGFLGPNGAGKTTTLEMMCGLLRPDGGAIEIDGQPLRAGRSKGLRAIGVAPQAIVVWETLTCLEQLELMGRLYGLDRATACARADELLAAFGLTDKRKKLAKTLSGGMQRRLNIALGLVHGPDILFLDEPQAGLDPQSRVLVREHIRSLAGEMTVVITTHDMEEAEKLSDRVCIIDHGRLLVLDTVDGIKAQLGEGDLYEIEIAEGSAALVAHLERLQQDRPELDVEDATLRFTAAEGAALLPDILDTIRREGLHLQELRIRKKTLEDVFIRLTGRRLRQ